MLHASSGLGDLIIPACAVSALLAGGAIAIRGAWCLEAARATIAELRTALAESEE